MATTIAAIIQAARYHLNERVEDSTSFWLDDELAAHIDKGARDLFRAINDNFQHYFLTITPNATVTQDANADTLTGVPADVGIVRGIEPFDLNARPGLNYVARDYNHVDFARARAISAQDPSQGVRVYYCITGQGAPVAAPTIQVAPRLQTQVVIRLSYVPSLSAIGKGSTNPIPGESDNALVAWCVAYALAKQDETKQPDANWLTIYSTEKQNILTSLTPRQTEDEDIAEAFFEDLWQ